MRKVLLVAILGGSLFALHCSSSNNAAPGPLPSPSSSSTPTDKTSSKTQKTAPPSQTSTVASHPVKVASDAGTAAAAPGANCQALSTCCSKITNSAQQTQCLQIAGKANEQVCTASETKFQCSTLTTAPPARGASCKGLTDGALYCGNDGPGGDPTTLYRCTGTSISIVRICPGGCTTHDGVDDACAPDGTTPAGANASCVGLSGDYCGTDGVMGNADTLYTCADDKISNTNICKNGCVTNPDATLNDTCADAPTTTAVSCDGVPDSAYCGDDLGGDSNTLYTCTGGQLTKQTPCTNGCTIAPVNVSDYCTSATPDCSFLPDGTYCGTDGVFADPNTLYTCQDEVAQSNPTFCTFGCITSGDMSGNDVCDGAGH